MTQLEIKNLTTGEILALKENLIQEIKFREGIGRDIELINAKKLKIMLEKELTQQETMGDRVIVRSELNEVKKDIEKLEKEGTIKNLMNVLGKEDVK
jgi:hypothetical protein